ncbi:MAG: Gfo/Idh/MocA family oxidoreductase [Ferruginibacter sp.]
MDKVVWGIIGCGDVTEVKSGPAFNKVLHSTLHAVMRRDVEKAADYARRHGVPVFYGDAAALINDRDVNAIYIATPPDSHEQYALAAIAAGKPVYLEKPMALNYAASLRIRNAAMAHGIKLSVAHYRNAQPYFNAIKKMLADGSIGNITHAELKFTRPLLQADQLDLPQKSWRVNPAVSGGGLFHDLAPHQLGILLYYFGAVKAASGQSSSSQQLYQADDRVEADILFENGVKFHGDWNFNADSDTDECMITGDTGSIRFSFFGRQDIVLKKGAEEEQIAFTAPEHVQQPLIEKVVAYFRGEQENPCTAAEGCEVMRLMELFTQ